MNTKFILQYRSSHRSTDGTREWVTTHETEYAHAIMQCIPRLMLSQGDDFRIIKEEGGVKTVYLFGSKPIVPISVP